MNTVQAKTTIEFNAAQVQEILADYVRKNFPHCRDSVKTEMVKFTVSAGSDDRYGGSLPMLVNAKVEMVIQGIPPHSQITHR